MHGNLLTRLSSDWQVPLSLSLGPLTTLSAGLGQAPRLGKGISYRPSKKPEKPIELWVRPLTLTTSGPAVALPCGPASDSCQAGVAMPAPFGAPLGAALFNINSFGFHLGTSGGKSRVLWLQAYEASPFCLQTREVLTELEIPHIYRCAMDGQYCHWLH